VAVVVDRDTGARQAVEAEGLEYRYAVGISDLDI
jgi:orotate phosphoribosyltransferase